MIIEANTNIEIYFSEPISSVKYFFASDDEYDPKAQYIKLIDLSYFDSSSVKETHYMFYQCSSLEEINFNNFYISKVTNMESMLEGCSNIKSLDLSNFDTSNVSKMGWMFYECLL